MSSVDLGCRGLPREGVEDLAGEILISSGVRGGHPTPLMPEFGQITPHPCALGPDPNPDDPLPRYGRVRKDHLPDPAEKDTNMDKGKRITGDARKTLAAELKNAYENGASIAPSPQPTGVPTGSSTASSPRPESPCADAAEPCAPGPTPEPATPADGKPAGYRPR